MRSGSWVPSVVLAVLCSAALVGPANSATIDVGLYANAGGTHTELSIPAMEPFWLYLVLDRSIEDLLGVVCGDKMDFHPFDFTLYLRCRFEIPDNLWILNFDESLDGLCGVFDLWTNPEIAATWHQVFCHWPQTPLCNISRCLMRVGLMALDTEPAPIRLQAGTGGGTPEGYPTLHCSFYVCPIMQSCVGVVGLRPRPAGPTVPVFVVNRGHVSEGGTTWGALKSLYR